MNTPIPDEHPVAVVTLQHVLTKDELGLMQTIRAHELEHGRGPMFHNPRQPLLRLDALGLLVLDHADERARLTITGAATIETLAIENSHHWIPRKENAP